MFCDQEVVEQYKSDQLLRAVNEAYFGRTPGIMRCFDAFCDFRDKYTSKNILRAVKNVTADRDEDLHRFCREMEREFGLYSFSFVIDNSIIKNMGTMPIIFKTNNNPKDNVVVTKSGYKFKKEAEMSIIILAYTGLLFDPDITDEEMFAVVLHEVGHNFQDYLNNSVQSLSYAQIILMVYQNLVEVLLGRVDMGELLSLGLVSNTPHKKISEWFNKYTAPVNKLNIYSYFNFAKGILKLPKSIAMGVISIPLAPVFGIMTVISNITSFGIMYGVGAQAHVYNYFGEQMADNFPSYYGFGGEQIDALVKKFGSPYGDLSDMVRELPLVGHMYSLMLTPIDMLLDLTDEHPGSAVRARSIIDSMKHDAKDPRLDPKLRKELNKKVDEIEKDLDKFYTDRSKIENPTFLQHMIDKKLFFSLNGGNKYKFFRSLFGKTEEEVEKRTNQLRDNNYIENTSIK